ncbi:MAG: formate--tetrahydrofolate ligase [Chloroflexia bacterium]|jgi:formate--tetrahydrofolate ligase|nr:formate--tetrahydrofolate ligase [Chloroflexia bacterium]
MTATQPQRNELEIAHAAKLKPIAEIASMMGLGPDDIEPYGSTKAKIKLEVIERNRDKPNAKYIVVTAITPTPLGEGKTTTSIGLAQGMYRIGKHSIVALRQPSLGPVFGIKGGGSGGGYSQVVPMEEMNLHLTGDIHAVAAAHNLLSAFLDASIFHGNPFNIDQERIELRHVMDMLDRSLRDITQGLGGKNNGVPRQSGFDIAVASEAMAILALCKDIFDLRARLGKITVAQDVEGKPVTAEQLRAAGAMTVLLKDAIKPNLMQTLEGTPALVHCGPFANIAHGNSSILADYIGIKSTDYLITEAGFGADMGFEKFCDIKCRASGLKPDVAVIVATVRALKSHSGRFKIVAGKPLDPGLTSENLTALAEGMENLVAQIENVRRMGIPAVVAINAFPTDTAAEWAAIERAATKAGAVAAVPTTHYANGGAGAADLAHAVVEAAEQPSDFRFLYPLELGIKKKIETIATQVYGADGVEYSEAADARIETITHMGYANLPICMAKTHLSLSHDPKLKGRPRGFTLPIRDVRLSSGAGFVYPLCGEMMTMPGLPSDPAGAYVDIDDQGQVVGLH